MPVEEKGRKSLKYDSERKSINVNSEKKSLANSDSILIEDIKRIRKRSRFNFKTAKFMLDPKIS